VKKKIIAIVVAVALLAVGLFQVVPALADAPKPLDHVQILPAAAVLAPGATQQFSAQGYDAQNGAISGLTYFWMTIAGGGTIDSNGLFTAGSTANTFTNTVQVLAVQGSTVKLANANVTVTTAAPGALDHVVITPSSKTLAPGAKFQFSAHAYDAADLVIPGLTYNWTVAAGAGGIDATGLFTAAANEGSFPNGIQVSVTSGVTKTANASIVIQTKAVPQPVTPGLDAAKLTSLFNGLLGKGKFANFLGGQWQIKNGSGVDTVQAIAGVVQTVSANSLEITPNGATTQSTFDLTGKPGILPKGTQLAVNDQVVVVTVNNTIKLIVKIPTVTTNNMPPGLKKQGDDNHPGKNTPPGWSKGNKTGWDKGNGSEND
jgi:hypothetical protein